MERKPATAAERLAWGALLLALVVVATFIKVPLAGMKGYFNLGEIIIYMAALLFGPYPAMLAGGVGAALADILAGYTHFAPFTLVIKGVEGLLAGLLAARLGELNWPRALLAVIPAGLVMIAGYAASVYLLYGLAAVPLELLIDIAQVAVGALAAIPLALALGKRLPRRR